jgi:ribose-phosphate pyrophosphokinase
MKKTYTLNLDRDFTPITDGVTPLEFTSGTFPGGEPNFRILGIPTDVEKLIITQRYNSVADLVLIIIANDAARRAGFKDISLYLPYFPAARQDRVCNPGESLTVKVFADLINSCKFSDVKIYSPHSEVTPALLDNVSIVDYDGDFLKMIIVSNSYDTYKEINIVCPDAGAGKRVGKLAKFIAAEFPLMKVNLIRCEKVRDVSTGALKEFFVQADDLGVYPTIICDDIVAYGGTFKGLGDVLRQKHAGDLVLFTSHADCIEGLQNMVDYFHRVYTTNSKRNWVIPASGGPNVDRLTCFGL